MATESRRVRPDTWLAAIWTLLVRIAVVAAVGYVLYRVQGIIVVILLAVMLAFTMAPLVDWLHRSPLLKFLPPAPRRGIATVCVFILLGVSLVGLVMLIVQPLSQELQTLISNWQAYRSQGSEWLAGWQRQYSTLPPEVREWIEAQEFNTLAARGVEQVQHVITRTVSSTMLLVKLILIPVLAYSFLTESRPIAREFMLLVPRSRARDALYVLRQTGIIFQSYAIGQVILALIAGVFVWVLMSALGLRYALAMGLVAAVTRVIPVVGPLIGGIPIMVLCAMQGIDRAMVVLVAFTVMHLVESKVIMPRLIGYRIKLHPAVVIIVLLIGAEFFGMWGMFLAAPVAAVIKVLLHYFLVRPRLQGTPRRPSGKAPASSAKELEVGHPAVAGIRSHTGAH